MELVAGQTLKQRLCESPLAPMEALDVAIQIAEGLASAHKMGILHLDIKSANIVLTASGNVKILDFGLARLAASGEHPPLETQTWAVETAVGTVAGTLPYMAPEQLRGREMDRRTDQFGFGVVCFELLSGRLPFSGTTVYQTSNATLNQDPPSLASIAPGVPPQLDWIVHRMLAKVPAERFASSDEVCAALKELRLQLASDRSRRPVRGRRSLTRLSATPARGCRKYRAGCRPSRCWPSKTSVAMWATRPSATGCQRTSPTRSPHPRRQGGLENVAFFFKGKEKDIREIASTLGVETVLEGSVRKSGNRIRVTAQLINAANGYDIW